MGYAIVGLVGLVVGIVLTALFGQEIAAKVKQDTEALVNGVENRLKDELAFVANTVRVEVSAAKAHVAEVGLDLKTAIGAAKSDAVQGIEKL